MQNIEKEIQKMIQELDFELASEIFSHIKTGKMLRSRLILNIISLKASNEQALQKAYKLCALIELIHLASLLHDDVIDESKLRRGAKSINAAFGAKNAIMMGDILYSKAFFELCAFDKELSRSVSNAVLKLSKGEMLDVYLSESLNLDENKYLEMLYLKTAALIEASAFCAAHLIGLNAQEFANYGKDLGIAFQLVDDILDITSDAQTLGKPAMSDFKEGKTTLPYILMAKTDKKNEEKLKELFKKELSEKEQNELKICLKPFVAESLNLAKNYAQNALKTAQKYNSKELESVVNAMLERKF